MPELLLAEVFGPTLQGEGPSAGSPAAFVRLAGCNLACAWCDTPYTWDWTGRNGPAYDPRTEAGRAPVAEIADRVAGMGVGTVVVTGGEPLLQQRALRPLLELLAEAHAIEIETNGTIVPDWPRALLDRVAFNVSPKLAHADNGPAALVPAALDWFADDRVERCFKFVCRAPADLAEVARLVERYAILPEDVWIMPEGTTPEAVLGGLRALAEPTIARGWSLTPRLHVLLWGNTRGR